MTCECQGEVVYWRGPAPFYFVRIPAEASAEIKAVSSMVTDGWGCIPCSAEIGGVEFTTALIPKDGLYLLPLKVVVRKAVKLEEGDAPHVKLSLNVSL